MLLRSWTWKLPAHCSNLRTSCLRKRRNRLPLYLPPSLTPKEWLQSRKRTWGRSSTERGKRWNKVKITQSLIWQENQSALKMRKVKAMQMKARKVTSKSQTSKSTLMTLPLAQILRSRQIALQPNQPAGNKQSQILSRGSPQMPIRSTWMVFWPMKMKKQVIPPKRTQKMEAIMYHQRKRNVDLKLAMMCKLKSVIWATAAGLIITSHLRSKLVSIAHLRLS